MIIKLENANFYASHLKRVAGRGAGLRKYLIYLQALLLPVKCEWVPEVVMVRAANHLVRHL